MSEPVGSNVERPERALSELIAEHRLPGTVYMRLLLRCSACHERRGESISGQSVRDCTGFPDRYKNLQLLRWLGILVPLGNELPEPKGEEEQRFVMHHDVAVRLAGLLPLETCPYIDEQSVNIEE